MTLARSSLASNIMFRLSVLAPSNTKLRGLVENLGVNSSFLERTRS